MRGLRLKVMAVLAASALLAGCGSGSESDSSGSGKAVTLRLNFTIDGSAAPFFLAKNLGLYEKAGLNVKIEPGKGSLVTAQTVGAGQDQFGYITSDAAIRARSEGGDLLLVGALQRSAPMSVVHHPGITIDSVEDLTGVRLVTTANLPQGPTLSALAKSKGVDPAKLKLVNVDAAAYAGFYQGNRDAAVLGRPGLQDFAFKKIDGAKMVTYGQLGLAFYGNSLATSSKLAKSDPETVKSFVAASLEGWRKAVADPAAAVKALREDHPDAGAPEAIEAQLRGSISNIPGLGDTSTSITPFDETKLKAEIDFLATYMGLKSTRPVTDYYSPDYQAR